MSIEESIVSDDKNDNEIIYCTAFLKKTQSTCTEVASNNNKCYCERHYNIYMDRKKKKSKIVIPDLEDQLTQKCKFKSCNTIIRKFTNGEYCPKHHTTEKSINARTELTNKNCMRDLPDWDGTLNGIPFTIEKSIKLTDKLINEEKGDHQSYYIGYDQQDGTFNVEMYSGIYKLKYNDFENDDIEIVGHDSDNTILHMLQMRKNLIQLFAD